MAEENDNGVTNLEAISTIELVAELQRRERIGLCMAINAALSHEGSNGTATVARERRELH